MLGKEKIAPWIAERITMDGILATTIHTLRGHTFERAEGARQISKKNSGRRESSQTTRRGGGGTKRRKKRVRHLKSRPS